MNKLKSNFNDWATTDLDEAKLNNYFIQRINATEGSYGSVVFRKDFNYIVFREDNSWVVTLDTMISDSITNWYRFDSKMQEISNWSDTYRYFVDEAGIFNIKNSIKEDHIVWRFLLKRNLERDDLIFCIFPLTSKNGVKFVGAFAFNLNDLAKPFRPLLQFVQPYVNIITVNGDLSVPVRPSDSILLKQVSIVSPEVEKVIDVWKKRDEETPTTYSFDLDQLTYWTRIDTIAEISSIKAYALTLSTKDLEYANKLRNEVFLYLGILMVIISLAVVLLLKKGPKTTIEANDNQISPMKEEAILTLIEGGETEFVEFKSSLRWDFREEKVNKVLEDVIMKSIAAFANAKGGKLLIGVTDDLEIIGLQKDLDTLRKKDIDYFELHLRKLINNQYGIQFTNSHLAIQFPVLKEKAICLIQITAATDPLYLSTKNKQGQDVEKFYVRSGNASQEITSLKEINSYVKSRFINS